MEADDYLGSGYCACEFIMVLIGGTGNKTKVLAVTLDLETIFLMRNYQAEFDFGKCKI